MDSFTVAAGTVVSIHYTLKLNSGRVVDSSAGGDPLEYLHGAGNIVPGLESRLTGRKVGDKLNVKVAPEDGYGERDPDGVQRVPRSEFPDDVKIVPGLQLEAQMQDGEVVPLTVTGIEGDQVTVDMNHPLAGETLHFQIEVTSVRRATQEELDHGHAHGAHGHHH
jgi:FKBP-type peptidyl-prolyl cis-trans isomerase SlyD